MDNLQNVPYERSLVQIVDFLVKKAKPCGKKVVKEYDWTVVKLVIETWQAFYPKESTYFYKSMKKWWENSKRLGVSKEKGGAMIQHKLEIPQKLYELILAIFPEQKWDKKFVNKFAKRFKLFAGNKI